MVELFANSEDPDQTPHVCAYYLGVYCVLCIWRGGERGREGTALEKKMFRKCHNRISLPTNNSNTFCKVSRSV